MVGIWRLDLPTAPEVGADGKGACGADLGPSRLFCGERPDARAPDVVATEGFRGLSGTGGEVVGRGGAFRSVLAVEMGLLRPATEAVVATEVVRDRADATEAAESSRLRAALDTEAADPAGLSVVFAWGVRTVLAASPARTAGTAGTAGTGGTGGTETFAAVGLGVLVDETEGARSAAADGVVERSDGVGAVLTPIPVLGVVVPLVRVVAVDLVVRVERTELIDGVGFGDAALVEETVVAPVTLLPSPTTPSIAFSLPFPFTTAVPANDPRETSGLIPPLNVSRLIPTLLLTLGVGLPSLSSTVFSAAAAAALTRLPPLPMDTLFPVLAAVGLRACGPVIGAGAESGEASLGRTERFEAAEAVEAADDSLSRRRPFGSAVPVPLEGSRRVGERGTREEEATEDRPEEVSPRETILEIVRGIPDRVVWGVVRRGVGEVDTE